MCAVMLLLSPLSHRYHHNPATRAVVSFVKFASSNTNQQQTTTHSMYLVCVQVLYITLYTGIYTESTVHFTVEKARGGRKRNIDMILTHRVCVCVCAVPVPTTTYINVYMDTGP